MGDGMITEIKGDLLKADAQVIIHGCNCQGKMNSGVAKAVREEYPVAFARYEEVYKERGLKLGDIIPVCVGEDKWVVNCMTQKYYGYDGKQYMDYDAVRKCFHKLAGLTKPGFKIAMPQIGCHLGGGDWNLVKKIAEEEFKDFEVEVYKL